MKLVSGEVTLHFELISNPRVEDKLSVKCTLEYFDEIFKRTHIITAVGNDSAEAKRSALALFKMTPPSERITFD